MATALLRPTPPETATWPSTMHHRLLSSPFRNPSSVPTLRFYRRYPVTAASASPSGTLILCKIFKILQRSHFVQRERIFIGGASVAASEGFTSSLESVRVFDLSGKEIAITELWRERKAIVAFARHFGCVLCRKRADLLASKKEVMDAAEVALVLIGPGSVNQAKTFSDQTKFPGEIYADPNHSSYDALKFAYGVLTTFTPSAGMKIIQSYMEGYRQDWTLSSERNTMTRGGWQQGGLLVAGPGTSNILFIHKDKEAGDDPDMEDVLKACCL